MNRLFPVILLLLLFGCVQETESPPQPDNNISMNHTKNPQAPATETAEKVFIATDKTRYSIFDTVNFGLHNGLNETIWYVEDLDGCMSGPFRVEGEGKKIIYNPDGWLAACVIAHYDVIELKSGQAAGFSWDIKNYVGSYSYPMGEIPLGEYRISMKYYAGLNETEVAILNSNYPYLEQNNISQEGIDQFWFGGSEWQKKQSVVSNPFYISMLSFQ